MASTSTLSASLLASAFKLLPKHGWKNSLRAALVEGNINLSESCMPGFYPQGQDYALVKYVREERCQSHILDAIKMSEPSVCIADEIPHLDETCKDQISRLLHALYARIEFMSGLAPLWPEALKIHIKASPYDAIIGHSLREANFLLKNSGLHFADMQWYSFRALLVQILVSTEVMVCSTREHDSRDLEDLKSYTKNRLSSYYVSKNSLSEVSPITNIC